MECIISDFKDGIRNDDAGYVFCVIKSVFRNLCNGFSIYGRGNNDFSLQGFRIICLDFVFAGFIFLYKKRGGF